MSKFVMPNLQREKIETYLNEGKRLDGRKVDEYRELIVEDEDKIRNFFLYVKSMDEERDRAHNKKEAERKDAAVRTARNLLKH